MQLALAATVVAGIGALVALHYWLTGLQAGGDFVAYQPALARVRAVVILVLAFFAAVFAAWLFRLAAATRAERRWPPTSMRTSSDVRIRYLTSADALVTQMKGGAIGLALLALGMAAWGAWLLRSN